MASKKKYYAVAVGRAVGIFSKWFGAGGAEEQVRGFPGARYKGFASLPEAQAFLEDAKGKNRKSSTKPKNKSRRIAKPAAGSYRPQPVADGQIVIYTDGGALYNPGPGGYGVVIVNGGRTRELSKGFRLTTNNRMELMACIAGLGEFKKPSNILLYSDSKYVINGITKGWAKKWRANGWMRTKQEPAINPDLWGRLLDLCDLHQVTFRWVKGHAGIEGNERCDELATRAASGPNLCVDTIYENQTADKQ